MTQTLAQLRSTVTATATAALTPNQDDDNDMNDPTTMQAPLEVRARLLAALFGAAAERAQAALLPKLTRSLGAAAADADEARAAVAAARGDGEGEEGGVVVEALGKAAATLEGLGAKLQRLAVGGEKDWNEGGEAMAVAVESC